MDARQGGGLAADLTCGSCGARCGATGKFCSECGARLAQSTHAAEYKQVTVLFADVIRSMDIAATLDMERLREVMTELVERSATVVRRYGGTAEYNGDGVMAIFGAPIALEDHAFRACVAALAIQGEMKQLATEVARRDQTALQVRIGLNSGQVIAGDIGSGFLGYVATGHHVGFAQRMESVASAGEVMLSESTARLVEDRVVVSEPQWMRVKGFDEAVPARRLIAIRPRRCPIERTEAPLVGRRMELAAVEAAVRRAVDGRGGVVNVVGPPGIGKSRLAREAAAAAARRGAEVCWAFCESHASDIPFHAVAALLRAALGVGQLGAGAARARVRARLPDADPQDLLLLDDLLGIAEPNSTPTMIDRDARRRRLTALVDAASSSRTEPALFIVEDAHWIDAASESLIADFLAVVPRTTSTVLITHRPEYRGALAKARGTQRITLGPLDDCNTAALLGELLGTHRSVAQLSKVIAERAAGNPFFAEEMVRELAQRGVLHGERGNYVCRSGAADVAVPATVQATIEARIDRLSCGAKRTLNAGSVIGARFDTALLAALGIDAVVDELLSVELIEPARESAHAEYVFRHPLIRAVAYESQLKSDRAELHRRLATVIETRNPASPDENAALIAEHREAAGDLHDAHRWHMRAAAWCTNRDLAAARISWERARRIADRLPDDDPGQLPMRIAPRTMLCATDFQARTVEKSRGRFAELQQMCHAAGDMASLAIGMSGPATELCYTGRTPEAALLSSQQMALLESIGDPTATMGLAVIAFVNWLGIGNFGEVLRWSQRVIDLADGDPAKGAGFGVGSPLALAVGWRGTARWWLGRPGWRQDLHDAVAMARRSNAETLSGAISWTYGFAMQYGVLRADDHVVRASEDALQRAQTASNDRAVGLAAYTLAVALLNRDAAAEQHRGLELMTQTRELWQRKGALFLIPVTDVWAARETFRRGDRDAAVELMRRAVDKLHRAENVFYGAWGTGVLVETLLQRAGPDDLAEAEEAIDRLVTVWAGAGSTMREVTLLRLRALLARGRGDQVTYRDLAGRYGQVTKSLGFEGH
ncbi:ATP-binding protein [Mycolicibacterium pulveris]|uniref:ATP-binding protein n=1 Tax=Mycolicibacterium pulveris TaxID=36813 RepID=UPI003CF4E049